MNSAEQRYARYLDMLQAGGEIIGYKFEPMKFILAGNVEGGHNAVTYTPDFMIVHPDHFEFVDIKAKGKPKTVVVRSGKVKTKQWSSMRDDARAKINIAAAQFPWFQWSVYYLEEGGKGKLNKNRK
jgi:hypothetical protein